jgi:hypothetical protein
VAEEEDWHGSSLVLGGQGPIRVSVTTQSGHELRASIKTQTPITIMPQNRWPRLRDLDWESEDVSEKREQCAS